MDNRNVENLKEYKREQRRRKIRKTLAQFVVNSEKVLYHGKKWIVVVLIPMLEVLANILTLMDDDHQDDHNSNGYY